MMRTFYPSEILVRLGVNESELWERYNVEEGDWLALSAIFLSEIFSSAILNPLSDEETRIQLQVANRLSFKPIANTKFYFYHFFFTSLLGEGRQFVSLWSHAHAIGS